MSFVKGIITCVNQSYEGISPPAEEVICVICIFYSWEYGNYFLHLCVMQNGALKGHCMTFDNIFISSSPVFLLDRIIETTEVHC